MEMKANHLEELLDRTLYYAIGFGALHDDNMLHIIYEPRHGKMCLRGKFGHFEIL